MFGCQRQVLNLAKLISIPNLSMRLVPAPHKLTGRLYIKPVASLHGSDRLGIRPVDLADGSSTKK